MKWLLKKIDETWTPMYRTSQKGAPRGYKLVDGVKTKFPKLENDLVVEDTVAKDLHDVKEADRAAKFLIRRQAKKRLKTSIDTITNLADAKKVIKDLYRIIRHIDFDTPEAE